MMKACALLTVSAVAAAVSGAPAVAQDDAARLTGRAAPMAPLSNRAMPAAPSIHRLSIGPLSNGFAAPPPIEEAAPSTSTSTSSPDNSVERLAARARHGDDAAGHTHRHD